MTPIQKESATVLFKEETKRTEMVLLLTRAQINRELRRLRQGEELTEDLIESAVDMVARVSRYNATHSIINIETHEDQEELFTNATRDTEILPDIGPGGGEVNVPCQGTSSTTEWTEGREEAQ